MLRLRLYPSEFCDLILFLRACTQDQQPLALRYQSVGMLVLMNYGRSWKPERLHTWKHRRFDRTYPLRLPVGVAKALYDQLQAYELYPHQQLLLDKLDEAIVNYQSPYAEPHVLGSLIEGAGPTFLINQP